MGQFKKEIDDINERLEILTRKFVDDEHDKKNATEARKAMYSCASVMDEVLEEVQVSGGDIDEIMNAKSFYTTPEETVEAFTTLEKAFHKAFPVVQEQLLIQREALKLILNKITVALDNIERAQQAGMSPQQADDTSIGG
ncbi:MAG: hypothetical protein K0U37_03865 [Gammaproteobacteria bacterium]|nr:hypothetical protein [Gammaproteobacteria bacterium]